MMACSEHDVDPRSARNALDTFVVGSDEHVARAALAGVVTDVEQHRFAGDLQEWFTWQPCRRITRRNHHTKSIAASGEQFASSGFELAGSGEEQVRHLAHGAPAPDYFCHVHGLAAHQWVAIGNAHRKADSAQRRQIPQIVSYEGTLRQGYAEFVGQASKSSELV